MCDLVAYFFRRSFKLLRENGALGLVATNTIAQGDTREGGLRSIINEGGVIYSAKHRVKWPGDSAVVVSLVHIAKNWSPGPPLLDEKEVKRISAYLIDGTTDESPSRLKANPYFSLGSKIYGQGFLFADNDDECTPIAVMEAIVADHPDWRNRILPYLVGEEINTDPFQRHKRYVIFMSDIAVEEDLDQWPHLRSILEAKVKPERMLLGPNPNNIPLKRRWWAYQAHRPELYSLLADKKRALVLSRHGQALAFAFAPTDIIYSEAVAVFDIDTDQGFAILQSRVHEIWARLFGSSIKDDLRYTPSDCFETFPFPETWQSNPSLRQIGEEYYRYRAALMAQRNNGLTEIYHAFHDKFENSQEILRLREIHAEVDRAVLGAYGWSDLYPHSDFILDYEDNESDESPGSHERRKPWRYRWVDDFRDEVLARLLELNRTRAEEQAQSAPATPATKATGKRGHKSNNSAPVGPPNLFDVQEPTE
jgi:hypothetical protein